MKKSVLTKLFVMLAVIFVVSGISIVSVEAATAKLNAKKKTLKVGETFKLKIKNASGTVKWKSSNKAVATVSSTGLVKAKKKGKATITANYMGKKYTCKITVKKAAPSKEHLDLSLYMPVSIDGVEINDDYFANYKITMINFFEPWCGPCMYEIPEINELYLDYKDKGFNVVGVFGDKGYSDNILEEYGVYVDYTIVHDYEFSWYNDTGYVPCTIFVDSDGCLISSEKLVGSRDYDGWYDYISKYVN